MVDRRELSRRTECCIVRTAHFQPEFVDAFPDALETGIFYISLGYDTCAHLCACGCGAEVVTPLSPAQWAFTYDGENITMQPSVGNWALDCGSHYVISRGRVRWVAQFSSDEIARNRVRDRAALEDYADTNIGTERRTAIQSAVPTANPRGGWRICLSRWMRRHRS